MGLTTGNSVVLTGLAIELDVANPKSYAVFGGVKGYALGGYTGAVTSTANKITYSSDTTAAQTSANLSVARSEIRGLSEGNTKGYTCGGYSSARITTTDITFFASDVTTTINSATLSLARNDYAGLSTYVNKGYIAGGATNSAYTNSIEFLYYSNSTSVAQTTVTLSVTRGSVGSISQPNIQGYLAGGATSAVTFYATTDKLVYSTDSCAAQTTANLSTVRQQAAGISECQTKGFWAGGFSSSAAILATVDKITFSTDTTVAQTTSNISTSRSAASSPTQGSSKGYVLGGYSSWAGGVSAVSDRILFATETMTAQTSANLSVAMGYGSSLDNIYTQTISDISGNVNAGTINNFSTYSRDSGGCLIFNGSIDYPNTISIAANSSYAFGTGDFAYEVWFNPTSFASGNNYILDLGSNTGNLQYYSGRLGYYNSTIGVSANLAVKGPSLIPNNWYHVIITRLSGTTYMYVNGNLITSNADTHNYSSPAVTIGNYGGGGKYSWNGKIGLLRLYSGKGFSATEVLQNYNANKNRFLVPSPLVDSSLVLNLDASNRISFARYGGSKAYFCGGTNGATTANKITYSNDTTAAQTSANLPSNHNYPAGVSDGYSKGYVLGDYTTTATTDKVTYSSETSSAQTTANLSTGRGFGTRHSNYVNKGYVLGGFSGQSIATGDRIIFATDTTSAVTSSNYSIILVNGSQNVSNPSLAGYTLGGSSNAGTDIEKSMIHKTVFSSDVTSVVSGANISQARHIGGGVSEFQSKGYVAGGYTGAGTVTTDRFTYANEFASAVTSANLSQARYGIGSASEGSSKGFFVGGYSTTEVATADKLTYATEITAAQTSANITSNRYMTTGLEEIYNVSSTSWFDTTTNGSTGTLTNGPTYSLISPSIIFDGTNDYVTIPDASQLDITGDITIYNIVNLDASMAAKLGLIINKRDGSDYTSPYQMWYEDRSGQRTFGALVGGGGVAYTAISQSNSFDGGYGKFDQVAFTVSGTSMTLWVNGVRRESATVSGTRQQNNIPLRLGGDYAYNVFDYMTKGSLASVLIYNRALNASEMLQNYNYYVNKLAIATIGNTKDFPAPSGKAIKSVNPYAQTGWYWLSVGGTTSQFWVDMDYDGGGWVMVINNRAGNGAMPNVTYVNATTQNINSTGNYGTASGDYTPANFNLWAGLTAWKNIADATAGSNTVVMFVATAYKTLADINNHTKRARFTWTGWSATYAWQGAASYVNEKGSTTAGLWSYHIANGFSLTTYDVDQDVYGSNCSTLYGNSPWWFGACWDGFYFPNGGGYGDFINWSGAGSDLHNYGAIYVR